MDMHIVGDIVIMIVLYKPTFLVITLPIVFLPVLVKIILIVSVM